MAALENVDRLLRIDSRHRVDRGIRTSLGLGRHFDERFCRP